MMLNYFNKYMKTKIIILITTMIVILGTAIALISNKPQKTSSPLTETTTRIFPTNPTSIRDNIKLKEYTDPSGFKFSYPQNLKITSDKITDSKIYSQLTLNFNNSKGSIKVKVVETLSISLDPLLKTFKSSTDSSTIKNSKLADLQAKEITTDNKIVILALDQNTLFTIETDLQDNKKLWTDAYQKLLSSFSFVAPTQSVSEASSSDYSESSGDIIDEGEEVVE